MGVSADWPRIVFLYGHDSTRYFLTYIWLIELTSLCQKPRHCLSGNSGGATSSVHFNPVSDDAFSPCATAAATADADDDGEAAAELWTLPCESTPSCKSFPSKVPLLLHTVQSVQVLFYREVLLM